MKKFYTFHQPVEASARAVAEDKDIIDKKKVRNRETWGYGDTLEISIGSGFDDETTETFSHKKKKEWR